MTYVNQYKAMMDQAEPPAHVQDDVMARLDALRDQSAPEPQAFRVKKRRRVPLAAKVVAGSLAAALVAGAVIAVPTLLPGVGTDSGGSEAAVPTPSFADQFGLALYADADEGGQTVRVATTDEGIVPFGQEGAAPPSALSYQLNLACVGEGIQSVTYAIDGEDVAFELISMKDAGDGSLMPDTYMPAQEFTLDYDDQQPEDLYRLVKVDLMNPALRDLYNRMDDVMQKMRAANDPAEQEVLNEELRELDRQKSDLVEAAYAELPSDYETRVAILDDLFFDASCEAAQKIGQATLSATATFTDGTTLTRRYRIAPVENFEQVFADRMAANREQGRPDDDPRLTAPLFEITEVS